MLRGILIGLDGSKDSDSALDLAYTALNPNRPYTQYLLKTPLKAGERVKYTLTQAQQPVPAAQPDTTANIGGIVIAGLVLVLLGGIGLYVGMQRTPRNRKKPR